MRAALLALSFFLFAANTALAQQAEPNFWLVSFNQDDSHWLRAVAFIDETRVSIVAPNRRRAWVWFYTSPREPAVNAGGHALGFYEFDCSERRMRQLGGNVYGPDGSPLGSLHESQTFEFVAPDTIGDGELSFVCSSSQHRPDIAMHFGNLDPDLMARASFSEPFNAVPAQ